MENVNVSELRVEISYKQIIKIALPISIAILVPQINYITNNIFLGMLGKDEFGAAGITGVFYLIFAAIGYGLNNGLQALIARRAGENQPEKIGQVFTQGMLIALCISLIGIFITLTFSPVIFRNLLHDHVQAERVISFLRIRIWGLPFLYLYQMRNALLVGTNQSRFLIIGSLAETLSNISLDYVLIFGKLGLPALGFNGAAVASIMAEAIGMLVVFGIVQWKGMNKRFRLFESFSFDPRASRLVLQQSLPLIIQYAISIISWEYFFILIERNSTQSHDLAVSNMMRNIFGFFGVFTWAFGATSSTMVSNIIGQKRQDEVWKLISKIMKLSMGLALILTVTINLWSDQICLVFGNDPMFLLQAKPVMRIVSVALILTSIAVVWLNAVTGTGNTKVNVQIELFAVILYCIYAFLVLEKWKLPIVWAWASEWMYWMAVLVPAFLYMRSNRWRNKII